MQGRYALEVDSGATFRYRIRPTIEEDGVRTPYDLTGTTIKMYVRDSERLKFAEYTLVTDSNGYIFIDFTPEVTARYVPHRRYFYVIDVTYPSGDIERILDGPMRIRPFTGARGGVGSDG